MSEGEMTDAELIQLLLRVRKQLARWAARYAGTGHAKRDVAATNELIAEIDKLPRNAWD